MHSHISTHTQREREREREFTQKSNIKLLHGQDDFPKLWNRKLKAHEIIASLHRAKAPSSDDSINGWVKYNTCMLRKAVGLRYSVESECGESLFNSFFTSACFFSYPLFNFPLSLSLSLSFSLSTSTLSSSPSVSRVCSLLLLCTTQQ